MLFCVFGLLCEQTERGGQMLAMLLQEAARRELYVEPRSLGMAKRGVCTFVQKAHALQAAGSQLTVVVNNGEGDRRLRRFLNQVVIFVFTIVAVNELSDIPAGKEKTDALSVPIAITAENDGQRPAVRCTQMSLWALTLTCLPMLQRS